MNNDIKTAASLPVGVPDGCRQKLVAEGKPYPRSNCAACGQLSPRWKECDAMLAAAPTVKAEHVCADCIAYQENEQNPDLICDQCAIDQQAPSLPAAGSVNDE